MLSDDEYREMQAILANKPNAGALIQKTGGLRKLRWKAKGKGKSGGVRTIYYWAATHEQILMLFIYPKSERADLTADQRKVLKRIVEEECP